MEEERRLAYVGITRAMRRLYMSHAWSRQLFGITQYNPPSRFLDEIPEHLIESTGNVSGRSSYGRQSYRGGGGGAYGSPPPYRRGGSGGGRDIDADIAPTRTPIASVSSRRPCRSGAQQRAGAVEQPGARAADRRRRRAPGFGEGVIIDISGAGDKAEAVINFAGVGTKHLSLAWAPLKKR